MSKDPASSTASLSFDAWMASTSAGVESEIGYAAEELPDPFYALCYQCGIAPQQAAQLAVKLWAALGLPAALEEKP